jgi:hypothetical protein
MAATTAVVSLRRRLTADDAHAFESNYADLPRDDGPAVKNLAGTAAIMACFQSHVDVFRASVPLGLK